MVWIPAVPQGFGAAWRLKPMSVLPHWSRTSRSSMPRVWLDATTLVLRAECGSRWFMLLVIIEEESVEKVSEVGV